jgi:hypothetical protein
VDHEFSAESQEVYIPILLKLENRFSSVLLLFGIRKLWLRVVERCLMGLKMRFGRGWQLGQNGRMYVFSLSSITFLCLSSLILIFESI